MSSRNKWIDSIKLIACLLVFFDHYYLAFMQQIPLAATVSLINPVSMLINGNFAVCMFLLISSYIAARQIYKKPDLDRVKKMLFKRYPRLMIPIFILSAIVLVMYVLGLFCNIECSELIGNTFLAGFYTKKLTVKKLFITSLYSVWWAQNETFNGPFWMLNMLFKGFFLSVIFALITSNKNKLSLITFAFLTWFSIRHDSYMLCFTVGVFLAYLDHHVNFDEKKDKNVFRILGIISFIFGVVIPGIHTKLYLYFAEHDLLNNYLCTREFYNLVGAALIFYGCLSCGILQKVFEHIPFSNKLNPISFAIYLVHWPIMCSFSSYLTIKLSGVISERLPLNIVVFSATLVLTLVIAFIYQHFIENKICDNLVDKLTKAYWAEGKS